MSGGPTPGMRRAPNMSRGPSRPRASTCRNATARQRDQIGTCDIECPPKLGETFGAYSELHSKCIWNYSGDFQKSITLGRVRNARIDTRRPRTWARGGRHVDAAAEPVGECERFVAVVQSGARSRLDKGAAASRTRYVLRDICGRLIKKKLSPERAFPDLFGSFVLLFHMSGRTYESGAPPRWRTRARGRAARVAEHVRRPTTRCSPSGAPRAARPPRAGVGRRTNMSAALPRSRATAGPRADRG